MSVHVDPQRAGDRSQAVTRAAAPSAVRQSGAAHAPVTNARLAAQLRLSAIADASAAVSGMRALQRLVAVSRVPGGRAPATLPAQAGAGAVLQPQSYSKTVTKPAGFSIANWPATLSAAGGDADNEIASKVNKTLVDMGWPKLLMSAHMIPKRLGGAGNNSNVRPWPKSFENNDWELQMEQAFNTALNAKNVGDTITYEVETTDMSAGEAEQVLKDADYDLATTPKAEG